MNARKKENSVDLDNACGCVMESSKMKRVMQSGSILNTLGLIRCATLLDNILPKTLYKKLVKINFMYSPCEDIEYIENRVDDVWSKSILCLKDLDYLDENKSTSCVIYLKSM